MEDTEVSLQQSIDWCTTAAASKVGRDAASLHADARRWKALIDALNGDLSDFSLAAGLIEDLLPRIADDEYFLRTHPADVAAIQRLNKNILLYTCLRGVDA